MWKYISNLQFFHILDLIVVWFFSFFWRNSFKDFCYRIHWIITYFKSPVTIIIFSKRCLPRIQENTTVGLVFTNANGRFWKEINHDIRKTSKSNEGRRRRMVQFYKKERKNGEIKHKGEWQKKMNMYKWRTYNVYMKNLQQSNISTNPYYFFKNRAQKQRNRLKTRKRFF